MNLNVVAFDDATGYELAIAANTAGGDQDPIIAAILEQDVFTAFDHFPLVRFLKKSGYDAVRVDMDCRVTGENWGSLFPVDVAEPVRVGNFGKRGK